MSRLALLCLLLSTLLAAQTLTREQQLSKLRLQESLLQLAERRDPGIALGGEVEQGLLEGGHLR